MRRIFAACALALTALAPALSLGAAPDDPQGTVVLLRPPSASEVFAEAALRIKSELSASGFRVVVLEIPGADLGADPRARMEEVARGVAPSAILAIVGAIELGSAELWVVDRITGKSVVRRLEVEASSDRRFSEVLAIRAQELLRASLVELVLQEKQPTPLHGELQPQAPEQVRRWVQSAVEPPFQSWRFALEAGAATLSGFGGLGTAVAPAARVRAALGERLWLRLAGVGLGTRPQTRTAIASATVSQNVALLELVAYLRPRRALRPSFSIGAGAERVVVEGSANSTAGLYVGERNARWFAAGDVALGLSWRLQAHWELQAEVHALFSSPRPVVRFFDVEPASVGQPTVLALLTLAGGA